MRKPIHSRLQPSPQLTWMTKQIPHFAICIDYCTIALRDYPDVLPLYENSVLRFNGITDILFIANFMQMALAIPESSPP
jgi:hypothetical protein